MMKTGGEWLLVESSKLQDRTQRNCVICSLTVESASYLRLHDHGIFYITRNDRRSQQHPQFSISNSKSIFSVSFTDVWSTLHIVQYLNCCPHLFTYCHVCMFVFVWYVVPRRVHQRSEVGERENIVDLLSWTEQVVSPSESSVKQ